MTKFFLLLALAAAPVFGATSFVPPNDPTGSVFTTNDNDAWADGRGIVFQMTGTTTIDSVGLLQDLTGVDLSYNLFQTTGVSGDVLTGATLLRSGSALTTTTGLEWVDFAFAPLDLLSGNSYLIQFVFADNSNQNFFYDNNNVAWSQGLFSQLDGTNAGYTINSVVAAFRVGDAPSSVPEPGTLLLTGIGGVLLLLRRRRAA